MSIVIDVAAEFTGKKAFKQADTATDKLTKSAKSLGKTLGITFGTAAILGFAKASVKAAAADQKAQQQLALALKNVGLGRDSANAESYIQRLQSEFGVVDDLLRPAYQQLAVATRDTAQTQRLLGIALDLSASTGKDLSSVTGALSKAYLGNNTALSKLGVGISKADLKTKSFQEITEQLAKTFKGAAAASAATFAGSMAKLGVAADNVKEIIGTGIIDSLTMLSDDKTVDNLAKSMQDLAIYTADVIRGIGILTNSIKNIPGLGGLNGAAIVQAIPILGSYITLLNEAGRKARQIAEVGAQKNPIQSGSYLNNQKAITKLTVEQQAAQSKILKDKKSQAILDKANLALNKGTDVFNLDAIQLNAAMINQTEQLGRVTSQAQLLQITNDMARLRVKQDILNLEAAIALKDDAAITAATNKLNKDLSILGVLTNQNLKLADIKSVLDSIVPKNLINISNLDDAIAKLRAMQAIVVNPFTATATATNVAGVTYNPTQSLDRNYDLNNPLYVSVTNFPGAAIPGVTYNPTQNADRNYDTYIINITTGIGDPNAIAETIDQYLQGAIDRGTLRLR
jgi:hypothetical protein